MDLTRVGFKIRTATVGYDLLDQEEKPVLIYDNEPNPPTYTPNMAQFSHHLTDGSSPFAIILAGDINTTAIRQQYDSAGYRPAPQCREPRYCKSKRPAATNYTGWDLDEFDTTVTQINQSATHQRRTRLLSKAEALMWRNGIPIAPLTNTDARVLLSHNLRGFKASGEGFLRLEKVENNDLSPSK